MGKIIRLSESDLTRIVRRVIKEQARTANQVFFDMKTSGKPWSINLFKDSQSTKFSNQFEIGLIEKSSNGKIYIFKPNEKEQMDFVYDCTSKSFVGQNPSMPGKYYNKSFTDWLTKLNACVTTNKGVAVPNATFTASNQSNTPQTVA
jgi:hypothetical protein